MDKPVGVIWGAVAAIALIAAVLLAFFAGGQEEETAKEQLQPTVEVVSRLGVFGTFDGEGLTRSTLAASTGVTDTADGGAHVPEASIDGPGRRVFAGVTIRLPKGPEPFVLRQIVPGDIADAGGPPAFVRWAGWIAILNPTQVRAGKRAVALDWKKTGDGLQIPAGATVRLRTLFRIPGSAGQCVGPGGSAGAGRGRAEERLVRAPAWLIRRPGRDRHWEWLRSESQDASGLLTAVRTGPTRSVLFRGSLRCRDEQPTVISQPDPDSTDGTEYAEILPQDPPDGY